MCVRWVYTYLCINTANYRMADKIREEVQLEYEVQYLNS